jgi:hypothetical protein
MHVRLPFLIFMGECVEMVETRETVPRYLCRHTNMKLYLFYSAQIAELYPILCNYDHTSTVAVSYVLTSR